MLGGGRSSKCPQYACAYVRRERESAHLQRSALLSVCNKYPPKPSPPADCVWLRQYVGRGGTAVCAVLIMDIVCVLDNSRHKQAVKVVFVVVRDVIVVSQVYLEEGPHAFE